MSGGNIRLCGDKCGYKRSVKSETGFFGRHRWLFLLLRRVMPYEPFGMRARAVVTMRLTGAANINRWRSLWFIVQFRLCSSVLSTQPKWWRMTLSHTHTLAKTRTIPKWPTSPLPILLAAAVPYIRRSKWMTNDHIFNWFAKVEDLVDVAWHVARRNVLSAFINSSSRADKYIETEQIKKKTVHRIESYVSNSQQ